MPLAAGADRRRGHRRPVRRRRLVYQNTGDLPTWIATARAAGRCSARSSTPRAVRCSRSSAPPTPSARVASATSTSACSASSRSSPRDHDTDIYIGNGTGLEATPKRTRCSRPSSRRCWAARSRSPRRFVLPPDDQGGRAGRRAPGGRPARYASVLTAGGTAARFLGERCTPRGRWSSTPRPRGGTDDERDLEPAAPGWRGVRRELSAGTGNRTRISRRRAQHGLGGGGGPTVRSTEPIRGEVRRRGQPGGAATTFVPATRLTISYNPTVAATVQFTVRNPSAGVQQCRVRRRRHRRRRRVGENVDQVKAYVIAHPELSPRRRARGEGQGLLSWLARLLDEPPAREQGELTEPDPPPADVDDERLTVGGAGRMAYATPEQLAGPSSPGDPGQHAAAPRLPRRRGRRDRPVAGGIDRRPGRGPVVRCNVNRASSGTRRRRRLNGGVGFDQVGVLAAPTSASPATATLLP